MEFVPVLREIAKKHFPDRTEQDSESSSSAMMKTYFEKMPSPCYMSQRRGQIDRQGVAAIVSQLEIFHFVYIPF